MEKVTRNILQDSLRYSTICLGPGLELLWLFMSITQVSDFHHLSKVVHYEVGWILPQLPTNKKQ